MARRKNRGQRGPRISIWDSWEPTYNDSACTMHRGACRGDVTRWRRNTLTLLLCQAHSDRMCVEAEGFTREDT
jgi:hypothetical protein